MERDRKAEGIDDIPSVHSGVHFHDGKSAFFFFIEEGGLKGRGSAVFWEEGAVDVDGSEVGGVEDGLGEDFSVGDDDEKVWVFLLEPVVEDFSFEGFLGIEFGGGLDDVVRIQGIVIQSRTKWQRRISSIHRRTCRSICCFKGRSFSQRFFLLRLR